MNTGVSFHLFKQKYSMLMLIPERPPLCPTIGHDWQEIETLDVIQTGKIWKECLRCGDVQDVFMT